jgi:hypothetical protein
VRDQLAAETGRDVLSISAVTGQNLDKLLWQIAKLLDEAATAKRESQQAAV